jgi:hypothetical protein
MSKTTLDPAVRKLLWRAFTWAANSVPIVVYDVEVDDHDRAVFARHAKRYGAR